MYIREQKIVRYNKSCASHREGNSKQNNIEEQLLPAKFATCKCVSKHNRADNAYDNSHCTIENAVSDSKNYTLPAATTETIGGVKQAADVAILETTDDITNVISTVNTLINNLKAAGVVVNS